MRKRDELLRIVNNYVIDSPSPSNISYMWNFGSLLGLMLVWQMVTGISLGMHYSGNILASNMWDFQLLLVISKGSVEKGIW